MRRMGFMESGEDRLLNRNDLEQKESTANLALL